MVERVGVVEILRRRRRVVGRRGGAMVERVGVVGILRGRRVGRRRRESIVKCSGGGGGDGGDGGDKLVGCDCKMKQLYVGRYVT